jgi:hypothetical protein
MRRRFSGAPEAGNEPPIALAELQAEQDEANAYLVRREVLRARYASAETRLLIDDSDADAAQQLADVTAQMRAELGHEAHVDGLHELRPGVPEGGTLVVLFYAVEPGGTALLLSALEGAASVSADRSRAIEVSAEVLRSVRAGEDPDAAEFGFGDKRSFLDEFFPDDADEVEAGAAALIARNRAGTAAPGAPDSQAR